MPNRKVLIHLSGVMMMSTCCYNWLISFNSNKNHDWKSLQSKYSDIFDVHHLSNPKLVIGSGHVAMNRGYDVIIHKSISLKPSTCKHKQNLYKDFHLGHRIRKYPFKLSAKRRYVWTGALGGKIYIHKWKSVNKGLDKSRQM